MKDNPLFYTASMAKLCADQGYFDKSLEIYRCLLESDSENEALRRALTEVEEQQTAAADIPEAAEEISAAVGDVPGPAEEESGGLEPMIKKWVELMVEHDLKSKFDKIRRSVKYLHIPGHET